MSIKVGIGISTSKDPLQAAKEAAKQAKINIQSDKFNLAIVFSSTEFSNPTVLKNIGDLLGQISIVGSSSLAVISDQGILKHGLLIMLLDFPEGIYFNTASVKSVNGRPIADAGKELGEKLLYGFKNIPRSLGLIFSDGLIADGSSLLLGLQERLGMSFPLAGASSSDNLDFNRTFQYINNEVLHDAACGILWGGKLNYGLGIKHGWKPLGKPHKVTRSEGNIVYEIDGEPAAKLYENYLAYNIDRLRKELKYVSIFYPIGINLSGEEEFLLRNLLLIKDGGALVFQGNIPQDSPIRLMIGTKESCLAATAQAAQQARQGLRGKPADFILVFDSVSRYMLLRRDAKKELEIIRAGLQTNAPIVGIYTYGEQAPLKALGYQGRAYFHNETVAVLAMGG